MDGIIYTALWEVVEGEKPKVPLSVDIKYGNVEGTRPLLDKMGELLGLELTAKEKK